jgi:Na+-transporting NADH:ubiquinone oxidoreductase subunit C
VPEANPRSSRHQNSYTLFFMIVLSLICAIILSVLASALKVPQELAKELDKSKQMLIATRILSPYGYFQVHDEQGKFTPANLESDGILKPAEQPRFADQEEILEVFRKRIHPLLVDDKGNSFTFQKAGLDEQKYVQEYRKTGYYKEKYKLLYQITANGKEDVEGYVIPINGMGLWDAIYGFLAVKPDGNTVIGISWYDQKETPGLGANISEPQWQSQFPGKHLFQESADGKTDFKTAPLGITVVKGKVSEALGNSPKALSAVDGMAGATLTGNGVTNAYRDVLAAYRPFLLKLHKEETKSKP